MTTLCPLLRHCCAVSELMKHEVRPSLAPRMALTFWSSGPGSLAFRQPVPESLPSPGSCRTNPTALEGSSLASSISSPLSSVADSDTAAVSSSNAQLINGALPATTTHVPNALTDSSTFYNGSARMAHRDSTSDQIFVNIASYRDTECKRTLVDLFSKAERPDRIFVGTEIAHCGKLLSDATIICVLYTCRISTAIGPS